MVNEKNKENSSNEKQPEKDIELSQKIEEYQKRLSKDPDSLVFLPLAEEYRKSGMLEEAIFYLEEGLKKNPTYSLAKITLARCYLESKNVPKAKDLIAFVLNETPDNVVAMKLNGQVLLREGRFEEAKKQFERVLSFRPNDSEILVLIEHIKSLH